MARFCRACGRPLDAKGHRVVRVGNPAKDRGRHKRVSVPRPDRRRGRLGFQKQRVYICRVVPAYDSPTTGRTMRSVPYKQRIAQANTRHVREEFLDG
jgi:hypothetical protein